MALDSVSPIAPCETLGALTSELEVLKMDAASLFSDYEGDASVQFLAEQARYIRDRANKLSLAFDGIQQGLLEL